DADRLAEGVAEEVAADRYGAALDLVGPAGVVAKGVDDTLDVAARVADGLAAVERLQFGQFLRVLLDEVGEDEHEAPGVGGVHLRPGAALEGLAGGLDGAIDVLGGAFAHLGDDLAGGGVVGVEGLALDGVNELVVDEEFGLRDGRAGRALL